MPDDWIPPEPEMPPWGGWLWQAWRDLDGDREMIPLGMGGSMAGRIPWTAIDRWARRYGVGLAGFDFLVAAIRVMDRLMIEHNRKRIEQ